MKNRRKIYPYAVWVTQGGGLARRLHKGMALPGLFVFVEAPHSQSLGVGDYVPEEWGLEPANGLARDMEVDLEEGENG